jgi:hypothetical protein
LREPAPHRPEHYEVAHRPRRVIRAHAGDLPCDEHDGNQHDAERPAPDAAPRPARHASALKRLRRVGLGPWEWIGFGVSILACLFLLREIAGAQAEHHRLRVQVRQKEVQLTAINKQKYEEEKRLAYLRSEKGRDQILAERGYLKPGDRILLFPVENKPNAVE